MVGLRSQRWVIRENFQLNVYLMFFFSERPDNVETSQLICEHGKLVYDIESCIDGDRFLSPIELVRDRDWELLFK